MDPPAPSPNEVISNNSNNFYCALGGDIKTPIWIPGHLAGATQQELKELLSPVCNALPKVHYAKDENKLQNFNYLIGLFFKKKYIKEDLFYYGISSRTSRWRYVARVCKHTNDKTKMVKGSYCFKITPLYLIEWCACIISFANIQSKLEIDGVGAKKILKQKYWTSIEEALKCTEGRKLVISRETAKILSSIYKNKEALLEWAPETPSVFTNMVLCVNLIECQNKHIQMLENKIKSLECRK